MANYKNPMNIIEALVQLRDDLKLWVANNLRTKLDKNLGTDNSGKVLSVDSDGNIVPTEADLGSGLDYSEIGLTEEEKSRIIKMQLDAPVLTGGVTLDWNTIYGANKYYIYSTDLPVNVDDDGLVTTTDSTTTEFNLGATMESTQIGPGDYHFYVIAGDGETVENRSEASNQIFCTKPPAPVVTLTGNTLSWDTVEGGMYVVLATNSEGVDGSGLTGGVGTIEIDGKDYSWVDLQAPVGSGPDGGGGSAAQGSDVYGSYTIMARSDKPITPDTYSFYVWYFSNVDTAIKMVTTSSDVSSPVYYIVTGEEES